MAKKAKLMRAYRLREQIIAEIERLAEQWECSQAEVVERAIEGMRAAGITINTQRGPRQKGDKTR